jgi:hypothetical protein
VVAYASVVLPRSIGEQGLPGSGISTATAATLRALYGALDVVASGTQVFVRSLGSYFAYTPSDVTSIDNGQTVIVDNQGRRWLVVNGALATQAQAEAAITDGDGLDTVLMTPERTFDYGQAARVADAYFSVTAYAGATPTIKAQAAIAAATASNGGTVVLPVESASISQTLAITNNNVKLIGAGSDTLRGAGTGTGPATKLTWTGSAGGTMVQFKTPQSPTSQRRYGMAAAGIDLYGADLAGLGFEFYGIIQGRFDNLSARNCTLGQIKTTCGVEGVDVAAGEPSLGGCVFTGLVADNRTVAGGTSTAKAFWLTGSINGNTSINEWHLCTSSYFGAPGWYIENADNNTFFRCGGFRLGGTAYTWDLQGPTGTGVLGSQANHFWNCGWDATYGCILRGTEAGYTAGTTDNCFWGIDGANGAGVPVLGTGCQWGVLIFDSGLVNFKQQMQAAIGGNSFFEASSAAAALTSSDSLAIYNGSGRGILMKDGSGSWLLALPGSGGLQIVRLTGTGKFNLPAVADTLVNGAQLSFGANDSGGAGFKLLRVPN